MKLFSCVCLLVAFVGSAFAGIQITPTTTLTAETSNNTSAANSFAGTSNGNVRPSNVSKEPMSSLLGTDSNVKAFAHLMPWWGNTGHINVGYSSQDAAQVRRQINDMVSRGFGGVVVAEGISNSFNLATLRLVAEEVSRHPGFLLAIQVNGRSLTGTDPTAKLIGILKFASTEFFTSSNYLRVNGRPVVLFFDGEIAGLDWLKAEAALADKPMFIFRNSSGFWHEASSGAFSWIGTSTSVDISGLAHLNTFYKTAQSERAKLVMGSSWKGFDDSIASWSKNRKLPQRCGKTWLDTIARAKNYLGAFPGEQFFLQVNTWNNYEEGTAIESGIDNCVSVAASISGSTLSWSLNGAPSGMNPEATIAKYVVFVSLDGENLMQLTEKAVGDRTLNLDSFSFDPGSYKFYVKAVGKPSIVNKVSAAVSYSLGVNGTMQTATSATDSDTTMQTSTSALTTATTLSTTTTSVSLRAGRVAVSADGNDHDRDDIGAAPMGLAMLAKAGSTAKSKLVHFEYNNHIWGNYSTTQKNDMTYSVMGAASRFGFSSSLFFSVIDNPTAAYNHLAAEINKSSSTNPLYILATGPMHTVCEAIKRSYSTKRPYVTVVSHSTWNETHAHYGSCTWSGIKTLGVKTIDIIDQNPRFATNNYADVSWLATHPDANIRWVWSRMQISHQYFSAADVSDAGEMWYWLKNDQYGSFLKLKTYLGSSTSTSGTTSGSCSASGSTLTQAITNFQNTCKVTYDKTKGHDCDPISSGYLCSTSNM